MNIEFGVIRPKIGPAKNHTVNKKKKNFISAVARFYIYVYTHIYVYTYIFKDLFFYLFGSQL